MVEADKKEEVATPPRPPLQGQPNLARAAPTSHAWLPPRSGGTSFAHGPHRTLVASVVAVRGWSVEGVPSRRRVRKHRWGACVCARRADPDLQHANVDVPPMVSAALLPTNDLPLPAHQNANPTLRPRAARPSVHCLALPRSVFLIRLALPDSGW